ACTTGPAPAWTFPPAGAAAPPPSDAPPSVAPGAVLGEYTIESFDLGFTPSEIEVPEPGRYAFTFTNTGSIPHDLTFSDGTKTALLGTGETETVEVDVPAEGLTCVCAGPGHEQAGMTGVVTVAGGQHAGPPPAPSAGPGTGTAVEEDPNAPPPVVYDPVAPKRLEGDVHEIELVMTEREM